MVMARRAVTEGVSCFIHINHYSRALWGHWGVRIFFLEVILGKGFMVYASVDALGKDALGTDL